MYNNGIISVFVGKNINTMFNEMYKSISNSELKTAPRGLAISELLHVTTVIQNPTERYLFCKDRKINPFFHVAESLQILLGKDSKYEVCDVYNKQLKQFLDDNNNGEYFAFYGDRIRKSGYTPRESLKYTTTYIDQIEDVIKKIQHDNDTRQAVISLWDPRLDGFETDTKDRPCNDMLIFKLRNNKLDMCVHNRSNDFIWGLSQTNVHQFSFILEYIATRLGVEVGNEIHYSDSLHIYDNNPVKPVLDDHIEVSNFYELSKDTIESGITCGILRPIPMKSIKDVNLLDWNGTFMKEIESFLYDYQIGRQYETYFMRSHAEIFDSFWYNYTNLTPEILEKLAEKYDSYDFFWTALEMVYRRKDTTPEIKKYIYKNFVENTIFEKFFTKE